jgi:citrate synthase
VDENVKIIINDDKSYTFPLITGTENEKAIDISQLRAQTGLITLDDGYGNTGACTSAITYLDGEKGILRYRGYPIEEIADQATFVETAYLLINGYLPTRQQLSAFSGSFTRQAALNPEMLNFFKGYPRTGHPMGLLSAMVCSLSGYYPELLDPEPSDEIIENKAAQLLSKVRTISAYCYKRMIGETYIQPVDEKSYIANFLHMMFSTPDKEYQVKPTVERALRTLLILHADHEQNCSTSTVRLIGSSWANMFASISGGISALWGALHGGANQKVIEMLEQIQSEGGNVEKFIAMAKDPNKNYRLMGFGHRVYKNFDPRASIIKKRCEALFADLGIHDPLLDIAIELERHVLNDDYFAKRKLYPNVDFYSGLIYKAIGIPTNMFTVMFAIGRMPGWIAHWKEMKSNPKAKIGRPRQIYIGEKLRSLPPIDQR